MHYLTTALALAACSLSSLPLSAQTTGGSDATRVLPASSWGMIRFAGFDACAAAGDSIPLLQWLDDASNELAETGPGDPRMMLIQEIARDIQRELGRHELHVLGRLHGLLQGGMAIGIGRPTIASGIPMPSIVIAINVDGSVERAATIRDELLADLTRILPMGDRHVSDTKPVVETVSFDQPGVPSLSFAHTGDWLLVSNSVPYIRECVRTANGKLPSIATRPALAEVLAHRTAPALLDVYLDVAQFQMMAPALVPYEIDEVCDAIGVDRLDGIYLGIGAGEGRCHDMIALALPGSESGIMRSLVGTPVTHHAAAYCPPDTLGYATMRIECRQAIRAGRKVIETFAAPAMGEIREGIAEAFEEIAEEIGVPPRLLFAALDKLGSEMTIAVPSVGGSSGMIPLPLVFVQLREDVDVTTAVAKVLGEDPHAPKLRTTTYEGVEIGYMSIPDAPIPLNPAFAVHDSTFILGVSVPEVKTAIGRRINGRDSLADQDDFLRHIADNPNASRFVLSRVGKNIGPVWRTVQPFVVGALDRATDGQVDPLILPEPDQMGEIFGDMILQVSATPTMIVTEQSGSLGLGVLLAGFGELLDQAIGLATSKGDAPRRRGRSQ